MAKSKTAVETAKSFSIVPNPGPQEWFVGCPIGDILYAGGRGGGKGLPLNADVATPYGFRKMRDIKVGATISNPDGGSSEVLGVYPQGVKQIYKLTFSDGTTTRCDNEHLWLVWIANKERKGKHSYIHDGESCDKMKVLSTDEIIERLRLIKDRGTNHHILIPMTKPVNLQTVDPHPTGIDPYLLGLLLGDGYLGGDNTTVRITSDDFETQFYLIGMGFQLRKKDSRCADLRAVGEIGEFIRKGLKTLKLLGTRSDNKFIPRPFLFGSIETRTAVLQGLMDSDGTSSNGNLSYTTVSEQLALDVRMLVESLGGWASISTKIGKYRDKAGEIIECKQAYTLYIQLPDKSIAFRLKRKKALVEGKKYNNGAPLYRRIESIEPDGKEETVCIRVDHPNQLFLTNNYIVTHNTYAILIKFHAYAMKWKELAQGLIIRKTFNELQDFREKKAKKILPKFGWTYKVSEKCWYHPNGATLKEGFIDTKNDHEKYLGHEYSFIVIEELGNFSDSEQLDLLRGSLRSAGGAPCFFIATGNPGGPGHDWVKARYVDPAPPGVPHKDPNTGEDRVYIFATALDNPQLMKGDPKYLQKLKLLKPHMVRAWVYGDWNATPKGHIFEREWWRYYDWNPEEIHVGHLGLSPIPQIGKIVQSWDTAYESGRANSKSCCTTWAIGVDKLYLLDVWQGKVQFPMLLEKAKQLAAKWRPNQIYIEGKASGKSIIQMMRDTTRLPVFEITRIVDDKETRAKACTPWIMLGKVVLPRKVDWVHDFIEELANFPKKESDLVDSVSQAINKIAHNEARDEKLKARSGQTRPRSIYGR